MTSLDEMTLTVGDNLAEVGRLRIINDWMLLMLDVEVIADPTAAAVALEPVRSRLPAELTEPASAATLAGRLGIARQKCAPGPNQKWRSPWVVKSPQGPAFFDWVLNKRDRKWIGNLKKALQNESGGKGHKQGLAQIYCVLGSICHRFPPLPRDLDKVAWVLAMSVQLAGSQE